MIELTKLLLHGDRDAWSFVLASIVVVLYFAGIFLWAWLGQFHTWALIVLLGWLMAAMPLLGDGKDKDF